MTNRACAIAVAALCACGPSAKPAASPEAPVQNEAPEEAPGEELLPEDEQIQTVQMEVGGAGTIAIDIAGGGAEIQLHEIRAPRYTLELSEWPDSEVFVQTLAQHMDGRKGAEVLHQKDGGRGDYEVVTRQGTKVDVTVIRNGVLCGYESDGDDSQWEAALAACQSMRPLE